MDAKIEVKPTGRTKVTKLHQMVVPLFQVTADGEPIPGEWPLATAEHRAEALRRVMEYADTLPFAIWLLKVDVICTHKLGVGLFDLPDMMTRDAFENGVLPENFFDETVMDTAREEGWS